MEVLEFYSQQIYNNQDVKQNVENSDIAEANTKGDTDKNINNIDNIKVSDLEARVTKIENEQHELQQFVNKSISSIQVGIVEIKTILQERLEKENLKNDLLAKDIQSQENRIKKIEDNQTWLWRTVAGSIISLVIGAIVFVIKTMN